MQISNHTPGASLRPWLALGRVSNLPTVWSNCLAAWLLGGGGGLGRWGGLTLAASLLYVGGVYLNDYFDAEFDRVHQPTRPLPAGKVSRAQVWRGGLLWLGLGALGLMLAGANWGLTTVLAGAILVYDYVHKATKVSPVLMGLCRFLLYLVVSSAALDGVTGFTVWCALALGCYVVGLSYVAGKESTRVPVRWWPLVLLAVPVVLALLANRGEHRDPALWLSFVLVLWVGPCLRHTFREASPNRRLTVSGLLAGIVLVDLLATAGGSPGTILAFAALFVLAILLQRYVPAT